MANRQRQGERWTVAAVLALALVTGQALVAGLTAGAASASAEPLRLGYLEFSPFTSTDARGQPQGSLLGMVSKVAAAAGLALSYRSVAPAALYRAVADGTLDLFIGAATAPEFVGATVIGESVLARVELVAYALDAPPALRRVEDLAGQTVIVLRGYSYGGWRRFLEDPANRVTRIEVESPERGLALLRRHRAPLLLEYRLPMTVALAGRAPGNLMATPLAAVDFHFVVSRHRPDAATVLDRLEATFRRLRDAGALP